MIAIRTYDTEIIEGLMRMPDLWATIAEDGQNPDDYKADCEGECWLLMMNDTDFIGAYNLHAHNSVTVQIHAHVISAHRKQYSYETGMAALQWIIDNTEYQKVVAIIPTIYENVKRFTCSFGFQEEGINRQSYLKNGELVDQYLLGITRDEIMATLKGAKAA